MGRTRVSGHRTPVLSSPWSRLLPLEPHACAHMCTHVGVLSCCSTVSLNPASQGQGLSPRDGGTPGSSLGAKAPSGRPGWGALTFILWLLLLLVCLWEEPGVHLPLQSLQLALVVLAGRQGLGSICSPQLRPHACPAPDVPPPQRQPGRAAESQAACKAGTQPPHPGMVWGLRGMGAQGWDVCGPGGAALTSLCCSSK